MSNKSKEGAHNQGEKDATKGVYERPNPAGGSWHSHIFGGADEEVEENIAYDKGHDNASKQKK